MSSNLPINQGVFCTLRGKSKDNSKLLFVNVNLRAESKGSELLPVGLASVMTYVDKVGGYNFDLLDININKMTDPDVERFIKENHYDCILLGCIVTHYKWVKWFLNMARSHQPHTMLIVGNSVGSSCPDVLMANSPVDVIVVGEGEVSCLASLEAIRNNEDLHEVEGIAFRGEDGIVVTNKKRKAANINTLPMIEWSYFDMAKYFNSETSQLEAYGSEHDQQLRIMPMITARGCAFKCSFCHYVFWDDPYRHRSADSIVEEIKRNVEVYDVSYISFWDDLSFASAKQVEPIADAIIDSGIKFDWNAAVRVDLFSRNKLNRKESLRIAEKMKKAGCRAVSFSLESANKKILEMMNKKIDANDFGETVYIMRKAGISITTSVVFGYPLETKETIRETFEMCFKFKVYPSIGFLMPLPSTGMYKYAKEHGYITDEDAYLDLITERQDITLNMTQMTDESIMNEIESGAESLNKMLKLNLTKDTYIRTAGKQMQDTQGDIELVDQKNLKRKENDLSLSYSEATFDQRKELGLRE